MIAVCHSTNSLKLHRKNKECAKHILAPVAVACDIFIIRRSAHPAGGFYYIETVAARMDGQIEQEVKDKRAELVMQIQTGIMAQKQAEKVGQTVRVLCDGIDEESGLYLCRTTGDAPEVDGNVCVSSEEPLYPGQFYDVLVDDSDLYDLYGTVVK